MLNKILRSIGLISNLVGLGIMIHDFYIEALDPLRFPPHGFWIGLILNIIGLFLLLLTIVKIRCSIE